MSLDVRLNVIDKLRNKVKCAVSIVLYHVEQVQANLKS